MAWSRLIKGFVLTSSCLLVGGYLLYAGGRNMMSGSKSARVFPEETSTTQPTQSRAMIYGSKSGRIVEPQDANNVFYADDHAEFGVLPPSTEPATQPATNPTTRRLIMGGSKSKQVFDAQDIQSLNPPATQPTREMFHGSKSAPVFTPQQRN